MTEIPGEKNSISLRKVKISSIFQDYRVSFDNQYKIFSLVSNGLLIGLALEDEGITKIINPYYLPDVVKGLLSSEKIKLEFIEDFSGQSGYEILKNYKSTLKEWLIPLHNELTLNDTPLPLDSLDVVEKLNRNYKFKQIITTLVNNNVNIF